VEIGIPHAVQEDPADGYLLTISRSVEGAAAALRQDRLTKTGIPIASALLGATTGLSPTKREAALQLQVRSHAFAAAASQRALSPAFRDRRPSRPETGSVGQEPHAIRCVVGRVESSGFAALSGPDDGVYAAISSRAGGSFWRAISKRPGRSSPRRGHGLVRDRPATPGERRRDRRRALVALGNVFIAHNRVARRPTAAMNAPRISNRAVYASRPIDQCAGRFANVEHLAAERLDVDTMLLIARRQWSTNLIDFSEPLFEPCALAVASTTESAREVPASVAEAIMLDVASLQEPMLGRGGEGPVGGGETTAGPGDDERRPHAIAGGKPRPMHIAGDASGNGPFEAVCGDNHGEASPRHRIIRQHGS